VDQKFTQMASFTLSQFLSACCSIKSPATVLTIEDNLLQTS